LQKLKKSEKIHLANIWQSHVDSKINPQSMSFNFDSAMAAVKNTPTAAASFTIEETNFYNRIFHTLDTTGSGLLPSSTVLPLLLKAKLPQTVLREVVTCF
jgi:hypothetical protein